MENKFSTILASCSLVILALCCTELRAQDGKLVEIRGVEYVSGYLARLVINENPFPGEHGYKSMDDSKTGMVQILWVIHCRLKCIPPGYRQKHVANIQSDDIIDIITADGQCDGFFRDEKGFAAVAPRVEQRLQYLVNLANKNSKPGKFSELLNFAQQLADSYVEGGIRQADRFAGLEIIKKIAVTGHAYSWMTDKDYYRPGGDFVAIPDAMSGSLGGNRFYTLRRKVSK